MVVGSVDDEVLIDPLSLIQRGFLILREASMTPKSKSGFVVF